MKMWLLFTRALTDGIGLYAPQGDFAHGPLNVAGPAALPGWILNWSHSICSMVFDLAISSVNHELAGFFRSNAFPGSLDRLGFSDENLS